MIRRPQILLTAILAGMLIAAVSSRSQDARKDDETARKGKNGYRHSYGSRTTNNWSGSRFRFPTEFLRELINAGPQEQEKLLAEKAERDRNFFESFYRKSNSLTDEEKRAKVEKRVEDSRQFWLGKIKEYSSLTPEQREQRIANTQRAVMLRDRLKRLMIVPPADRSMELASIPDADRALVQKRLAVWDKLPADVQKQVLEHDSALHYFSRLEATPAELRAGYMDRLPSSIRRKLEEDIQHWNEVPAAHRETMQKAFASLFSLTDAEQEKTLTFLPEQDRKKLEEALNQFDNLTPAQRDNCFKAYQKYLAMSPEQRQQFNSNAERWKSMTEDERAAWRALAAKLPPPATPLPTSPALVRPLPPVLPGVPGAKQHR